MSFLGVHTAFIMNNILRKRWSCIEFVVSSLASFTYIYTIYIIVYIYIILFRRCIHASYNTIQSSCSIRNIELLMKKKGISHSTANSDKFWVVLWHLWCRMHGHADWVCPGPRTNSTEPIPRQLSGRKMTAPFVFSFHAASSFRSCISTGCWLITCTNTCVLTEVVTDTTPPGWLSVRVNWWEGEMKNGFCCMHISCHHARRPLEFLEMLVTNTFMQQPISKFEFAECDDFQELVSCCF